MSKTRRLAKGLAATLLSQVINIVGNIVLVPVFLSHWGELQYGEWLMVYAAVAYMTVVDFGLQMYVVNLLSQAFTRGDMGDYHRTLHSAFRMSLTICAAVLALMLLAFAILPIGDWLDFAVIEHGAVAWIATLLGLQLLGAIPQGQINGVYRTIGEYHRGVMVGNAQRAAGFAATGVVVGLGGGPQEVAAAQLVPLVLSAIYVWVDLRRRHPEIQLGLRQGTFVEAKKLLLPSLFFFLLQVSAGLVLQGTTLIVGSMLGATAVVGFATTRTLANLVTQVTGTINATLWPDLTTLEAQGRYDTLRELQRLASKVVLALTFAAAIFLHFNGAPLMRLWTRGAVVFDAALMDAFLVYVIYLGYMNTTTVVMVAANQHRSVALSTLIATGLGIGLAIGGAAWMGSAGVMWAMFVADVGVRGVRQSREACRMIAQPLPSYLFEVLGRGAVVGGLSFAVVAGLHLLIDEGIAAMLVSALVAGVVVAGLTFGLWLAQGERRRVLRMLRLR